METLEMEGFWRSHIKPSSIPKDVDENTHFKKTPIRDSSDERLSQFDEEEEVQELNAFVAGLSLRPYNLNYLSPRPQFLRYKPDRRRHIFHGEENRYGEIKDGFSRSGSADSLIGIDGLGSNCSSLTSSFTSVEGSAKQEDEESEGMEESDEEEEEEVDLEGEKGWNLKGVFKTLFLMVVLVLSTSFISCMNSSTPSCNFECSEAFRNGICKIQNHTFEAASKFESGNVFEHQIGGRQMGSFKVEERALEKGTEVDIEETEPVSNMKEREVLEFREMEDVKVVEGEELDLLDEATVGDLEEVELPDETIEGAMLKSGEMEAVEMVEDETKEELDEMLELQIDNIKEVMNSQIVESCECQDIETAEISKAPVEEFYNKAAAHEEIVASEAVIVEEMENDQILKHVKFETFSKVAMGVLMLFVSVASLFFGILFKRRNALEKDLSMGAKPCSESLHAEKDSSPASKPCSKSLILKEHCSVLPSEQHEEFEQVYSLRKNLCPSIYSWEKTGEDYFQRKAPSVQLLGEFVVRESKSCSKVGEGKAATPTPVRRSSRIRNRVVLSP